MNTQDRIAEVEAEIARLEALRGTPNEPPALDAQVGQLRRTLHWHTVRLDPQHYNTGRVSLYPSSGRSKRLKQRSLLNRFDYPAVSL